MAPVFFRKRRQHTAANGPPPSSEPPAPVAPIAPAGTPPPPSAPAPPVEPPRSYAQLADLADEIVASSWDANLPLQLWLNGVRQLAVEGEVYRCEGNYDMAFVRMATVLKLLTEVLPHHHAEWRTLGQAQLDSVQKQIAAASSAHALLKSRLIARTTAFYASRQSPSAAVPSSSGSSPALLLRNTVTTAATVYRDSPEPTPHPRRAPASPAAPPRANRLRAAFSLGKAGGAAPPPGGDALHGALPEPGAEEVEGEEAVRQARELLPREQGRRIPLLGEAVAHAPVAERRMTTPQLLHAATPERGDTPMPLPGEDESDEEDKGGGIAFAHGAGHAGYAGTQTWSNLGAQATTWPPTSHASGLPHPALASPVPYGYAQAQHVVPPLPSGYSAHPLAPTHPVQFGASPQYAPHAHPYSNAFPPPPLQPPYPGPPPTFSHPQAPRPPVPPLPSSAALRPPQPAQPPAPSAPPATPTPPPFAIPARDSLARQPLPSAPSPAPSSPSPAPGHGQGMGMSSLSAGLAAAGNVLDWGGTVVEEGGSGLEALVARNESGAPLRPVILPSRLISHFMHVIAAQNTSRNIETCGLLLGTLRNGTFRVSHLLVPKQEGTADTCIATHDEEQLAFQEQRGLMTLGWIHTHPTQSIFLSSLDLHTHAAYQLLLAEALAVVCAPSARDDEPQYGVFRMTDPPGVQAVVACREVGAFHPHPPLPLYTDVDEEGGHCRVEDVPFKCVDLR